MKGLIERITNRGLVAGLRADLEESDRAVHALKSKLVEFDAVLEKADNLVGVVNVLKMRFDMLVPAAPVEPNKMNEMAEMRPPVR